MPPCHPFRPVPGQCGPNRRGPLPAPPFDPRDYWATRKFVSSLFEALEAKLDKADVVDPGAEAEAGQAADAKSTYEELSRILAKLVKKADKTALDDKRDKSDLNVYGYYVNEFGEGSTGGVEGFAILANDGYWYFDKLESATFGFLRFKFEDGKCRFENKSDRGDEFSLLGIVDASPNDRKILIPNSGDACVLLRTQSKLAAVTTDDAAKPANGDLVKYDAANDRLVKATAGIDYLKEHQDISGKRDSGDFDVESSEKSGFVDLDLTVQKEIFPGVYRWRQGYRWRYEILIDGNLAAISNGFDSEDESKSVRQFSVYAYNYIYRELEGTTVSVVRYVDGPDTLVGAKYVGGLTSTNNPAFVSAVQNTPTSGMPEDMPTDWGTFGTVGAALAALAAGLKWCKNILGSLASGYSTFAAWIASKLDHASLVPEYSETSAYSVGVFVYHDGNIYQCKTAIAEGGEAWNAEHWELRKLDDFFTESNSLLNGRLAYSRNATGLKDRAFNTLSFDGTEFNLSTALEGVTPTASGQPRDLLIVATATAATTISFTAGTIKGDKPTIDGAGKWLITLTEFESGVWYCRQIKMEDAQ